VKTSDFDYDLPEGFIAQTPVEPRDHSRLLILDRAREGYQHTLFYELGRFLRAGDLLVLNETRVIPARLFAYKVPTGGRVEILLLRRLDQRTWETLVGGKGLSAGKRLQVEDGPTAEIVSELDGSRRIVRFGESLEPYLDRIGHVPLPPYIHSPLDNPERYQTVYALKPGSAAAPTAGLHFTPQLIEQLRGCGIRFAKLTLHVGLDTFAPVTEERVEEHRIHNEWCQLSAQCAELVNRTRGEGGRIIAVGTTSVRTLESAARLAARDEVVAPWEGFTDLFITPGYAFKAVEAMITNFHLPRSTLLMLVSAFAGRERVLAAYQEAIDQGYRFYSFGDAMLIL
jgi:S-adenosylmethionine:tRNA ribosyltransferase-isomerase